MKDDLHSGGTRDDATVDWYHYALASGITMARPKIEYPCWNRIEPISVP